MPISAESSFELQQGLSSQHEACLAACLQQCKVILLLCDVTIQEATD